MFICSDELIIFWQSTVKVTVTSQSFDYNSIIHGIYDENDTLLRMYVPQDNSQN